MRYWTVMDWCTQRTEEGIQIIELGDNAGPEFSCPENMEVSTGYEIPFSDEYGLCYANVSLPVPVATDACQSNPITFDIYVDGSLYATSVVGAVHINELGLGAHTITWKATDACLNSSSCSFEILVVDEIAPTVTCDQHTIISLSDDEPFGTTVIDASVFDDGSFDNCSDITFEARRMTTCIDYDWTTNGACIDLEADGNYSSLTDGGMDFKPCVPFACCDVGQGPIMIEVKVKDAAGNENFCMVEIEVQDKLPPTIECPPNIIVSCDFWPNVDDLVTGQNLTLDQDPMASVFGTVIDGYEVQDDESARQPIIINDPDNDQEAQPKNWGVDGWADDNCDLTLDVRLTFTEDCSGDNLPSDSPEHAVRYFERRFTAVDGQSNSISCTQRIWEVDFDPFFITDETCADANQNDGVKWPCDEFYTVCPDTIPVNPPIIYGDNCSLIGVTYADERFDLADGACYKIVREWKVIDWCQFDANEGTGSWTYIQTIKVFDNNGPEFSNCPTAPVTLCAADAGVNIPNNNQVFLGEIDPNGTSCTAHVQGSHTVRELCSNSVIYDVKLHLFDASDYVQLVDRTQVSTDAGGNAVLSFDTETSSLPGIRENGLPYNDPFCGDYHRIVWTVEDGCGNFSTCEYLFRLEDCKPPIPVCVEGLSTVVMPSSGSVIVMADQYDASSIDDCTPSENLLFSFSGDTYQPSRQWNCDNVPTFGAELDVQVWAADGGRDLDCNGQIDWSERNKEFCVTTIVVLDNDGVCGTGNVITGDVMTFESLEPVELTTINLTHPSISFPSVVTVEDGKYEFTNVPLDGPYTITPTRNDDHKNGISTLDLVRIQKHLLGVEPLTSPYQFIAADVNNSESISALDLVEIRKLILGIYSEFPENTSWRFVDSKYVFEDLTNPWPFNESIVMENLETLNLEEDFMAVKVGDLNNTVVANAQQVVVRSGREEMRVAANAKATVQRGEICEVEVTMPPAMIGFQWTLNLDGLNYMHIESDQLGDDNVGRHNGKLTMSYAHSSSDEAVTFKLIFKATKDGRPSEMITVTSEITETEGYLLAQSASPSDSEIEIIDLDLDFGIQNIMEEFALYQNAPNPFTGQTIIGFDLPRAMTASLTITDATGRIVQVVEGDFAAGYNTVGLKLFSEGVYYYNLTAEDFTATKKMIVTK